MHQFYNRTEPINVRGDIAPLALTIRQAAATLGVSRATLYRLAKSGEIKLIHVRGRTLVRLSELTRLLDNAQEVE